VIWDANKEHTLSAKTHHQKIDFNIFEGRTVTGSPSITISQGKVVYKDGKLNVVEGAGRYIKRPAYPTIFDAVKKYNKTHAPYKVER
jgi:dihydropyrimidinase